MSDARRGEPGCNPEDWIREPYQGLAESLSASTWLSRELPPPDRLLGDVVTTTSRTFIVGRTGLGKTMLGFAIGLGMALGTGFLHWRASRACRVLYVDGEMPSDLLQQRIRDAVRRAGVDDREADNLMVYSIDDSERIAELYPTLGRLDPLNTDPGQDVMQVLCTALRPDVVIFDNVQSLLAGVLKEEESWLPTLGLVQWLSRRRIGQLWLDHTGHSSERQYGTATKSWRFDTVGLMTPLAEEDRAPHETAFMLSFEPPGKARRRTPTNWVEFEPRIIRLREDAWTSEPVNGTGTRLGQVPRSRRVFHDALRDALAHAPVRPGETTHAAWEAECIRRDLIEQSDPGDDRNQRARKLAPLRAAKSELQAQHWIGVDGERVMDLTRSYR